jgi:histidyl-tRNA synthetase
MSISSAPPSGFRDFSSVSCALRDKAVRTISQIYKSFGFEPIETSALENLEVLLGKGGGENEKLIFKVLKRGEKLAKELALNPGQSLELADMGLRFDLTLPLARFYAGHQNDLPKPFKAFHIAPVWRAERAQKGRYREFTQCDLDIIGSESWMAEVEVISAILTVLTELGITGVSVHLNDRALVEMALEKAGVTQEKRAAVCVALDKLDKTSLDSVLGELIELTGKDATSIIEKTLLTESPNQNLYENVGPQQYLRLREIASGVAAACKEAKIQINPSLMRGFDYYTGPVFEFRHPNLSGSLGGGGRYDRLLEKFGVPQIPACGGSIGFERLILLLEESGNTNEVPGPKFFVAVFSEELLPQSIETAAKLRAAGVAVDLYPGLSKLKAQFKYADQKRASYALVIGPDEAAKNLIRVKNLKAGIESLEEFNAVLKLPPS